MESLFTFVFKYQPFFFRRGEFTFQGSLDAWLTVLILLALAAFLFFVYRRTFLYTRGRVGWTLLALRGGFFLLLFLLAMRPSLVLSRLVPKENLLAVLVDNSRSMGIPTEAQEPRGLPIQRLVEEDSNFLKALDERFYLRLFRFDSRTSRPDGPLELDWRGDQTNIASGLEGVLADT